MSMHNVLELTMRARQHKRLQLTSSSKEDTRSSLDKDPSRQDKRGVNIEEHIEAGAVASGLYWKILS